MLPDPLEKLIDSFAKLPGVGRKTAERFSYFLLRSQRALSRDMGETLMSLQEKLSFCRECFMLTDAELCGICRNPRRENALICVVETIFDAEAIERSGEFRGRYHVLHGRIAPLDHIAPEDLKIRELVERVERLQKNTVESALEIILATNPSSEGETTALYLQKLLKSFDVKLTRIATGIPVGADLEYADEVTLARAIKGRHNYE